VWLRFLDACGDDDMDGGHDDVTAITARRRGDAAQRIRRASWNRAAPASIASTVTR
jgi:hypothetical protein